MATIRIAQALRFVVVFREEKCRVVTVGGILAKELIYGAQETLRLIRGSGALAAEACLQISHQECGCYSLACYVGHDKPKPLPAKIKEIIVVPANLASLHASACVFEVLAGGIR